MIIFRPRGTRAALAAASLLALTPGHLARAAEPPDAEGPGPRRLPVARALDVPAEDRLFQRGLPVTDGSFSPEGFHYAYLHLIPGGFLRRKPQRCTFLLDLQTGETRPIRTPKGRATRVAGWDATGRYLLIEAEDAGWLSPITGSWSTYHWIFDVVTSDFPKRRNYTGVRDGRTFLWKHEGTYHGTWDDDTEPRVRPMYEGELARMNQSRGERLSDEDKRRLVIAERLAVGLAGDEPQSLAEVLSRLDRTWTQRGQRDPVVSDLFGERPTVFHRRHTGREWSPVLRETEYWDREGSFWNEFDPLPRDLQYRRDWDEAQGGASYFNYVNPDLRHAMLLYSFDANRRVLRILELPESWRPAP